MDDHSESLGMNQSQTFQKRFQILGSVSVLCYHLRNCTRSTLNLRQLPCLNPVKRKDDNRTVNIEGTFVFYWNGQENY
jgi:hypothetical protein